MEIANESATAVQYEEKSTLRWDWREGLWITAVVLFVSWDIAAFLGLIGVPYFEEIYRNSTHWITSATEFILEIVYVSFWPGLWV